jgi:hypothetical protein
MPKPLKKLFSLWLVLNLALMPLQAFTAVPVSDSGQTCAMHQTITQQGTASYARHRHSEPYAATDAGCPHCGQCEQHGCSGDSCAAGSCGAVHVQPGAIPAFLVTTLLESGTPSAYCVTSAVSRTAPPPLRPPR